LKLSSSIVSRWLLSFDIDPNSSDVHPDFRSGGRTAMGRPLLPKVVAGNATFDINCLFGPRRPRFSLSTVSLDSIRRQPSPSRSSFRIRQRRRPAFAPGALATRADFSKSDAALRSRRLGPALPSPEHPHRTGVRPQPVPPEQGITLRHPVGLNHGDLNKHLPVSLVGGFRRLLDVPDHWRETRPDCGELPEE